MTVQTEERDEKRIKKVRCISGYRGHQGFSWRKNKKEYIQMLKLYLHRFFRWPCGFGYS